MTDKNIFRSGFVAHTKGVFAKADALGKTGHAGVRGTLREILAGDLLRYILPPEFRIGTGQVILTEGQLSPQIDIIVYSPNVLVPALYDTNSGFFAIESCCYVIEVKSTLTRSDLKIAIANAKKTKQINMLETRSWAPYLNPSFFWTSTPRPIPVLFAFGSDLHSDPLAELTRYCKLDPNWNTAPEIPVICVKGRGYWYFDSHRQKWFHMEATTDNDEVISFLTGVSNTLPELLVRKAHPQLGHYLSANVDQVEMNINATSLRAKRA